MCIDQFYKGSDLLPADASGLSLASLVSHPGDSLLMLQQGVPWKPTEHLHMCNLEMLGINTDGVNFDQWALGAGR